MRQHFCFDWRNREGYFVTVHNADDNSAQCVEAKIYGIIFFRRREDGTTYDVATLNPRDMQNVKDFCLEQPKLVCGHKKTPQKQDEKAFILKDTSTYLCLDADAVGLEGPVYVKEGKLTPGKLFQAGYFNGGSIVANFECPMLGVSFQETKMFFLHTAIVQEGEYQQIMESLGAVKTTVEFEATVAAARDIVQQSEATLRFFEQFTAEDYQKLQERLEDIRKMAPKMRYQLLSRMVQDCKYYLNTTQHPKHLWAGSEWLHILVMRALWDSFDEKDKPEWCSLAEIRYYQVGMGQSYLNWLQW